MKEIFVDTHYFVARINPKRSMVHTAAKAIAPKLKNIHLVTTESILIELMNYLAEYPPSMRQAVANLTRKVLDNSWVETIPHTREALLAGLELYESRLDKGYSLTDCISMNEMHKPAHHRRADARQSFHARRFQHFDLKSHPHES
ncbi:MAG: hypothetical protein WKF84_30515 [Pyrinomonadaceae bacterium]